MNAVTATLLRRPAALYEQLRKRGPVQWSEPGQIWLVIGYSAARTVLRDTRFRMPGPGADSTWGEGGPYGEFMRGLLLEAEGAQHDRLRRALGPAFAPRAIRARQDRIDATMDSLLDDVAGAAEFDGVAAISSRLPVSVVGDLVGVPERDRARVSALCRTISTGGGLATGAAEQDAVRGSIGALDELAALVEDWLAAPDQLLAESVLATSADLTRMETVATVFSLYLAGHDTSRNMLSALLLALATRPDLAAAADEVDRVLLAESPLTFTARVALADVEVEGQRIAEGDRVRIMLGAANHELLTTGQSPGPLAGVSFGEGRHVCLGAHVARLEGTTMLAAVARRWSSVRLAGDPQWTPHFLHRGLDRLPLEVTWRG